MMDELMEAVPSPRRMLPVLIALAIVCLLALVLAEPGTTSSPVARALTAGASFVLAGITISGAAGVRGWPGQRSLGAALVVVGGVAMLFGLAGGGADRALPPHAVDGVLRVLSPAFLA